MDTVGLSGAVKAAKEGAARVAKAGDDQPTIERKVVAKVVEAAKAQVSVTAAAAGDVIKAGVKVAAPIVGAYLHVADRVTAPARREVAEAARETFNAGKNVVTTQRDNVSETIREVKDAWNNAETPERAVIAAGYELLENGAQSQMRTIGSLLNLQKQAVEGGFEIAINNPLTSAARIGVTEASKGLWSAAGSIFGFGQNIAGRGANGAVEAGRSIASTGSSMISRNIDQQKENFNEISDAVSQYGRGFINNLNPFNDDVSDAWNNAPTTERKVIAAAYETAENLVQGTVSNVTNAANVGKEVAEAGVENAVNVAKNGVDIVTGTAGAVTGFVGGLFD